MSTPCYTFGCRSEPDKVGVLLANLGTPDAPDAPSLRRYLKQFLADRRVIEVNKVLWWFLLNGIILDTRPKRSARLYKRIWREDGSPLLRISENQATLLGEKLRKVIPDVEVTFGMRYGSPSLESRIDLLIERGCRRILLVPMYPQYAAATTGSTCDAVFAHILKRRWVPSIRMVEPYYAHPEYISALSATINDSLIKLKPDKLLLSYHGVPQSYVKKGDPYCCMCTETTRHVVPKISFPKEDILQTYQSRFGKEPWLQPYTDETVEKLAHQGIKKLAIAAPGFTADCLETLDEIGNEALELFHEHGGSELNLIPCLNDDPRWIEGLFKISLSALGNWKDPYPEQLPSFKCCALVWFC